ACIPLLAIEEVEALPLSPWPNVGIVRHQSRQSSEGSPIHTTCIDKLPWRSAATSKRRIILYYKPNVEQPHAQGSLKPASASYASGRYWSGSA
ncbi:unnamed protein product, partial [Sphacelaria rigidula]